MSDQPSGAAPARVPVQIADLADLTPDHDNANRHTERGGGLLEETLRRVGAGRSIVLDRDNNVIAGNGVVEQAANAGITRVRIVETDGTELVAVRRVDLTIDSPRGRELAIRDNTTALRGIDLDAEVIQRQAADHGLSIEGMGISDAELAAMMQAAETHSAANEPAPGEPVTPKEYGNQNNGRLAERFIVPPFSVLDCEQKYWRERRAQWESLGVDAEAGREHLASTSAQPDLNRGDSSGGSSFDPVLAELMYSWFMPPRVSTGVPIALDPWAGEATKGLVCTYLGYAYTGVELRGEQVDANQRLARQLGLAPTWVQGDSAALDQLLPAGATYDLVFSSPPYFDLEIYSGSGKDGSSLGTYAQFIDWYRRIIQQAADRLADSRFFVLKVGEIREGRGRGAYRNFVGDTITACIDAGLHYYNEMILRTTLGSLPVRCGAGFLNSRKIGKCHQNVLVFYKGNVGKVPETFKVEQGVRCADLAGETVPGGGDPPVPDGAEA